jgi:hypothetical protein
LVTFKDDGLIRRLASEFIPVVANTQDLQWHESPASRFFLGVVERTDSETLSRQWRSSRDPQGMYILAPDGTSFGFTNDHEPVDIQRFMDRGLRGYRKTQPTQVVIADADIAAPWSARLDPAGAVIRVFSRIRPLPVDAGGLNRGVGRDFLWIYPEEIKALIEGDSLPPALVARTVRFHLVDGVRGTPTLWRPREVRRADATTVVTSRTPGAKTLAFTIEFSMSGKRQAALGDHEVVTQGYRGRLEGEVTIDLQTRKLRTFRAFADGTAWGEGHFTPNPPAGHFRLIVGMLEAVPGDEAARVVPPEGVATKPTDAEYHDAVLTIPNR